jgi:hypothetical protein
MCDIENVLRSNIAMINTCLRQLRRSAVGSTKRERESREGGECVSVSVYFECTRESLEFGGLGKDMVKTPRGGKRWSKTTIKSGNDESKRPKGL